MIAASPLLEEKALSAADLVVGCITENNPKYWSQTLRLVQSIRWFGGELSSARVLVCAADEIDDAPRRVLEGYGAEVRVVPRFDPRNGSANRLQFFFADWETDAEMALLLDCDTVVVRDPLPLLRRGVFQAKIAPVPSVTHEAFERVFQHFGVKLPPRQYLTGVTRTPTIRYCNAGIFAIPFELARTFVPVWRDFNARLVGRTDLLGSCAHHCHQAALSLALEVCQIPFEEAPVALNYQLNVTHLPPPPGFLEVDPAILHYHHLVDSAGYLLPCPYPLAQARIDAFNERRRREKVRAGAPALGKEAPPQIAVLGMHRSGTSAVTRLLHLMGCYGGPQDRFPTPDEANPKGYWENSDMVILDDALLATAGASWFEVAGLDLSRLPEEERNVFRERAREIVEELDPWGPWAVKDPRFCLLFPWWREVLERPVCVLVWRDPLPVARSLEKRHGLPLLVGIALWEAYTRGALANSLGVPRVLVSYHELMTAPGAVLSRLREELAGLGVEGLRVPEEREIREFLDPGLYRNARDVGAQRSFLTVPQLDLLASLESGGALALDPVPPVSAGARETLACYQRMLAEERALRSRVVEEEHTIAGLQTRLAEEEHTIAGLQIRLAEGEHRIVGLQTRLAVQLQKEVELRWAKSMAEVLDNLLAAVFASRSWRVGHAMSRLFRRLFPSGETSAVERWNQLRSRDEAPAQVSEAEKPPASGPRSRPAQRVVAPSAH